MARPNFLVIMSDQHNPRVSGYAGDPWVRTPNLDALAAAGTAMSRAYCAAPLCVPSRMSFLTGQFPHDLEIWTNAGVLPSQVPTFAHALTAADYDTVLCGRMHFVGPDQNHGFQQRLVGDVSGAMHGGTGEMFEGVWSRHGCGQTHRSLLADAVGPGCATYDVYDEAVTARACDWLSERRGAAAERPFCLVVGLLLPHNPYVCAPELFAEYMDRLGPGPETGEDGSLHPAVAALKAFRGVEQITPEMARRARAAYYGLVTTLDHNVGVILAALEESGLRRNTVVLYTSDHGDLCGEHGLWWKDSFYEGSVGVPMIWSGPGRVCSGNRCEAVASLLDVAPTLTDLAQTEPLPAARGHSLTHLLATGETTADWPDTAFAETLAAGQRPGRMICTGRWKLVHYHGYDTVQLFDLHADPGEHRDLGALPEYQDLRERLVKRVDAGWDGDLVERRSRETVAGLQLVRQAQARERNARSERWPFPAGRNRRVE